jgi:hypothetical protein
MNKIYQGDVGTQIILDCGSDISTATVRKIKARKPSGALVEWNAAASGSNSITYTTQANDIDEAGSWSIQAYIELPGWAGRGETFTFSVLGIYK